MKIEVTQEISVPSGFYCNANGRCYKKHRFEERGHVYHICGVFSQFLKEESCSDRVIKCQQCIDATMQHIKSGR